MALTVTARGATVQIPADPVYSEDARDPGTLLLAETMEVRGDDAVLVVGGGSGLSAVVAARLASRGRVVVAERQVTAADQVELAARLNGVANVEVIRTADLASLRDRSFDVALLGIALVPSAAILHSHIQGSAILLRPGGHCYLAGGKQQGILSAADRLRDVFGNAVTLAYRKGHRVVVATRALGAPHGPSPAGGAKVPSGAPLAGLPDFASEGGGVVRAPSAMPAERVREIELRGRRYLIGLREGVFARGGLDEGTRLLAESLQVRSGDVVLDLGCGGGLVGLVAATLAHEGRVYLVDSDVAAVELARENLVRNGVGNATVHPSNGYSAVAGLTFDVIAANPPFHVGRYQTTAIAERFVGEAPAHLRKGGRLYVVANRFLRYEPLLERAFGNTTTVAQTGGYKLLLAERRSSRPAPPRRAPYRGSQR